jgi:uncharacterized protein (DUF1697 family)
MSYVALLRGINVGGKNPLPMKELLALFAAAGCSDVRSYIASGNILFNAASSLAARIPELVGGRIEARFGFQVPLVLRTGAELAAVAKNNPFLQPGADVSRLMVMFLAHKPSARSVAALDPNRSPPDEAVVRGREIYLRCPNGFGRSKLSNSWFDSQLATMSTGRNWRTVLKLLELAQD